MKPHSSSWSSATCAAAIVHSSNHFFRLYQQYKLFESKLKLRQVSNHWKRVLEAAKPAYGNKITWLLSLLEIAIVFSAKVHLVHLFCSTVLRFCLLRLLEQNYMLKIFQRTLIWWLRYLFTCFSITNLKLYHIYVTPKMIKKVMSNLDLSKVFQ